MKAERLILEATIPSGFARQVIELPEHWSEMSTADKIQWRADRERQFADDAAESVQVTWTIATYCDSEIVSGTNERLGTT